MDVSVMPRQFTLGLHPPCHFILGAGSCFGPFPVRGIWVYARCNGGRSQTARGKFCGPEKKSKSRASALKNTRTQLEKYRPLVAHTRLGRSSAGGGGATVVACGPFLPSSRLNTTSVPSSRSSNVRP